MQLIKWNIDISFLFFPLKGYQLKVIKMNYQLTNKAGYHFSLLRDIMDGEL